MSPLTQVFLWWLAGPSQLKYNIHLEYLSDTQAKISWKYSCASGLEAGILRHTVLEQKEQEKKQEQENWTRRQGQKVDWGGGEVIWEL